MSELIDYLVRQVRNAYAKKHRAKSKLAITQAELQRLGRLREEGNLLCDNALGAVRQAEKAIAVRFGNKMLQHFFGDREIGDNTVFQGSDCGDVARRAVRQAEEAHRRAETHVESMYAAYDRLHNQYRIEQYRSMKAYAAWKAAKKELASHKEQANDAQR